MKKHANWSGMTASGATLALGFSLGGCVLNEGESAAPEDVGTVAAAVTNSSFYDATGTIEIRIKTCDATALATTNCAYCIMDDAYALVGGGANILGEASGGAMLQASFPNPYAAQTVNAFGCTGPVGHVPARVDVDYKNTWMARASGASHQLQTYAIGLRLKGTNGVWFKPWVSEPRDFVAPVYPPSVLQADLREQDRKGASEILIGGGTYLFKENTETDHAVATNAYLVGSFPVGGDESTRAWRGRARSTTNPAPTEVMKVYGLFMNQCPAGYSQCFNYPQIRSFNAPTSPAYGTVSRHFPGFGVNTSVGGHAVTITGARYLADLIPFNGSNTGFTVRSKAYTTGSGPTVGYGMSLGVPHGIYTAVYNHSNKCMGVLDARSDSTAPLAQITCTYGNEPAHLRFAMTPRPGGYVALKFEHSGLCVDISGNSQSDGAAAIQYPCNYADNQLVQLLNNGAGKHYFKFKHSGKCLDVSGAGTADGVQFVQYTCNGQTNQTFHFDD
jgi:hypothetical protein